MYCSGHGAAGYPDDAALLCSEARNSFYRTVTPYVDVEAFREAGFFEEFVIWFDGCRDWPPSGMDNSRIDYKPRIKELNASSLLFTAFSCHSGLKSVEWADDCGKMHSIFTRTLLRGLEGDAADWNGMINGPRLKDYLEYAILRHLPEWATKDKTVDKQPHVDKADPGIIFGPLQQDPSKWRVVLNLLAAHNGSTARIWGREDERQLLSVLSHHRIENGKVELELRSGIYAADVPSHNVRFGFDVSRRNSNRRQG